MYEPRRLEALGDGRFVIVGIDDDQSWSNLMGVAVTYQARAPSPLLQAFAHHTSSNTVDLLSAKSSNSSI